MFGLLFAIYLSISHLFAVESQVPSVAVMSLVDKAVFVTYEVTAYTAGYESTGKRPGHPEYGITASGKHVQENHTIACPRSMEFGTEIYIPYFDSTFYCEDRGGAIKEGKLDVYMPNLADALDFGRQKLDVLVMDKP